MEARRRSLDAAAAMSASRAAAAHFLATSEFRECRAVVAYAALRGELPVDAIVEGARTAGKALLWPRLRPDGGLEFAACARIEGLVAGRYGVGEPPAAAPAVAVGSDAVLLVPGVAFDEWGGRLGRGGGAWDRTLSVRHGAVAFGVGYEFQIVDAVPREAHDRDVDALLTERSARRCRRR